MGYTTEFKGQFKLNKPLTKELIDKLCDFSDMRHCKGDNGTDYNTVADGMPGFWCQWIPAQDGNAIKWDGGEKFYDYVEWLQIIIDNYLKPNGYEITEDSKVSFRGENFDDIGYIYVKDGKVLIKKWETQ